jgi:hypothetical protein
VKQPSHSIISIIWKISRGLDRSKMRHKNLMGRGSPSGAQRPVAPLRAGLIRDAKFTGERCLGRIGHRLREPLVWRRAANSPEASDLQLRSELKRLESFCSKVSPDRQYRSSSSLAQW